MARRRTTNYLNNHDILKQIHKSKTSFCHFESEEYGFYDAIVLDIDILVDEELCYEYFEMSFDEWIQTVIKSKVKKLNNELAEKLHKVEDFTIEDLVFRWMTYSHIPLDENWPEEKEKKKLSDGYLKVNFPPYQHYIYNNRVPRHVGESHCDEEGNFNTIHGAITPTLGKMYMLLVEKISKKGNWRNYTYIDEMRSSALVQLSQVGLQFNESRGINLNPFAFYTTVVNNVFKRVLNSEKRVRNIRDDLLEMAGQTPSFTRQLEAEIKDTGKELYQTQWNKTNAEMKKEPSPLQKMMAARKRKEAIKERQENEDEDGKEKLNNKE